MAGERPHPQSPALPLSTALGCLALNALILPGGGTAVAGAVGGQRMLGRGVAQFLLAALLVGWVWGIFTGFQLVANAPWSRTAP